MSESTKNKIVKFLLGANTIVAGLLFITRLKQYFSFKNKLTTQDYLDYNARMDALEDVCD